MRLSRPHPGAGAVGHRGAEVGIEGVLYPLAFLHMKSFESAADGLRQRRVNAGEADVATGPLADKVREVVDTLAFEQACAIWLIDVCDCTYQQAAFEMRLPPAEVANNVRRGRETVRQYLEADR